MRDVLDSIQQMVIDFADWMWGFPLLLLMLGGGIFLSIYSKFKGLTYFAHAWKIVLSSPPSEQKGALKISAFSALSAAMANTIGMGNIAGVAVAISIGGPGTLFWMWVTSIFGMTLEMFTSTLAVVYRTEADGKMQAGPMYMIMHGLGKRWKPLALLFCAAGMIAALPIFQANQLTKSIQEIVLQPMGVETNLWSNFLVGVGIVCLVSTVILGGIKSIAAAVNKLVPLMVGVYLVSVLAILAMHHATFFENFLSIFTDAFSAKFYQGEGILGSAVGGMMVLGARRASFSNEAGLGTVSMFHGISNTKHPLRQGLVASLGPFIDTVVVCTLTGLAILSMNEWKTAPLQGVGLVFNVFKDSFHVIGSGIVFFCVVVFSITTLFAYSYLGSQCCDFIFGVKKRNYYSYIFIASILLGSVSSMHFIISVIDGADALMAIPTIFVTLVLSPKVIQLMKTYRKQDFV